MLNNLAKNLLCGFTVFFILIGGIVKSQDIPLYSQKVTNSLLYNPATAGSEFGSLTFSHRKFWSGIDEAPSSNLLSIHTPFAYHKFGVGLNLFSETLGIYDRLTATGAFAYHLNFTDETTLSMGVSGEYNFLKVNTTRLDVVDQDDQVLFGEDFNANSIDFSFGLNLRTKYFNIGGAANRISTGLGLADESNQLSQFYSSYINFKLPVAGETHLIEPILTFRQLSAKSNQYDLGLYYTFNNLITLGGGYRSSFTSNNFSQLSATAALRIKKKIVIGYTYEAFNGQYQSNVGNSNEITIRLDFRDQAYNRNTKNSRKIMNSSLAFRRKTLTQSSSNARSKAKNHSKKLKKRLKKNYLKSPSYRMNSSKKLHTKKVKKIHSKRKKKNKQRYKRTKRKGFR